MVFFLMLLVVYFAVDIYFSLSVMMKAKNENQSIVFSVYAIVKVFIFLWAVTLLQRV